MPAAPTRTQITHTDQIERALAIAAMRWPGESPSALLEHLIVEGAASIESKQAITVDEHRRAAERLAGAYPGLYSHGYLEAERDGWPE